MRERFVDEVVIDVRSGNGGAGAVSFRREKAAEFGGPDGGDGGRGGDVWCEATDDFSTLLDYRYRRRHAAGNGGPGRGCQCFGADGEDLVLRVPVGTQVFDLDKKELRGDLSVPGARLLLLRGGRGGRGNEHFKTSVRRAPKFAQPGEPGEAMSVRLELKLMADVGVIGLPNVGKSALVSHISAARPRVANYPFTTLVPHLGVVQFGDHQHFVVADVPGLIAGAHEGVGLGARFLRHVERVRILVHMLTVAPGDDQKTLEEDFRVVEDEIGRYKPELLERARVLVLNQMDRPDVAERLGEAQALADKLDMPLFAISAASGAGLRELVMHLGRIVTTERSQSLSKSA